MFRSLRSVGVGLVLAACLLARDCAADPPEPAKVKLSETEQKILDLTNQARAKEKLPPLQPNALLFDAARGHSANMARKGEMNHVLDGKEPKDRIKATGYRYSVAGENIGEAEGANLPAQIFDDWMNSKLHRANILDREFTEIGIGYARNDKGEWYYTQVFARPKKKAGP
jgi:uncharacterized protein YkwD